MKCILVDHQSGGKNHFARRKVVFDPGTVNVSFGSLEIRRLIEKQTFEV